MTISLSPHVAMSVFCLSVIGCAKEAPPPEVPEPVATQTSKANAESGAGQKSPDTMSAVKIDDRILKACGDIPTARFSFDSAEISADAQNALDAVARCFISGPLKGKGLKLIGHADARGETEYNLGLGQKRAGSVGEFLAKKGLSSDRIATSSKGEFEAVGIDEDGWARDRKVEVLLGDG